MKNTARNNYVVIISQQKLNQWCYYRYIKEDKLDTIFREMEAELVADLGSAANVLIDHPVLWPVQQKVRIVR